jgi:hypothetical protein
VHPVVVGLNRAITVATGLKMLHCPVKPRNGLNSVGEGHLSGLLERRYIFVPTAQA